MEQFGIILIRLREDPAAEISDAFEFAIEVNRLLPVRDCLRGFFADAVHAKQLLPGGLEDGRCFAEALEQLPDTNRTNVLDQVEGHECFPAVHATDIADLTASGKAGGALGRLPFPMPAGRRGVDRAKLAAGPALRRVRHLSQIIERINPGRVAVAPNRLHRIAADAAKADELERLRRQRSVRRGVEVAHDVHLALAAGARTMPPQTLELHVAFTAVIPLDRQLITDGLEVRDSHVRFVQGSFGANCHAPGSPANLSCGIHFAKPALASDLAAAAGGLGGSAVAQPGLSSLITGALKIMIRTRPG